MGNPIENREITRRDFIRLGLGVVATLALGGLATACAPASKPEAANTPTPSKPTLENPTAVPTATATAPATATATAINTATRTATAPATVTATGTATASPTRKASPTPEGPRFSSYDTWAGTDENGAKLMFATLPDDTIIFVYRNGIQPCNDPGMRPYFLNEKGSYQGGIFTIRSRNMPSLPEITGKLINNSKAEGTIAGKEFKSSNLTCPPATYRWTANLIGNDQAAILKAYRDVYILTGGFPPGTPDEQVQAAFERIFKVTLSPAGK